MKRLFFVVFSLSVLIAGAQDASVNPSAVLILDRMAAVIGDLQSCSYTLATSSDVEEYPYGMVKKFSESEVYMVGPDKMLVQSRGSDGHRGYWYNGEQLICYFYNENNYTAIDAPPNILETIDSMHSKYGIQFPAADFFYPTFTDDILDYFDHVELVGEEWLAGKECFHVRMENKDMIAQIWISDDALNLPAKMVVQYLNKEGVPQYEATFKDWKLNPVLPGAIFEFTPPEGARQVAVAVKSSSSSKQ